MIASAPRFPHRSGAVPGPASRSADPAAPDPLDNGAAAERLRVTRPTVREMIRRGAAEHHGTSVQVSAGNPGNSGSVPPGALTCLETKCPGEGGNTPAKTPANIGESAVAVVEATQIPTHPAPDPLPADLARVVDAWPTLPDGMRAAVLGIIDAAGG